MVVVSHLFFFFQINSGRVWLVVSHTLPALELSISRQPPLYFCIWRQSLYLYGDGNGAWQWRDRNIFHTTCNVFFVRLAGIPFCRKIQINEQGFKLEKEAEINGIPCVFCSTDSLYGIVFVDQKNTTQIDTVVFAGENRGNDQVVETVLRSVRWLPEE